MTGFNNRRMAPCCYLWIVAAAFAFTMLACQKEVEPDVTPPASTTVEAEVSECKDISSAGSLGSADFGPECMEWSFDGAGTLSLTHVNAIYNCCIDSVTVTTTNSSGVITIVETEYLMNDGCDCLCPYDIAYQIGDVAAGQYTLRVFASYSYGEEPVLLFEFALDLNSTPTGSYCTE